MSKLKYKELIITSVVAFSSTFGGVFMAASLDKSMTHKNNIKISKGFAKLQSQMCITELEILKDIEIINDPVKLPKTDQFTGKVFKLPKD